MEEEKNLKPTSTVITWKVLDFLFVFSAFSQFNSLIYFTLKKVKNICLESGDKSIV